MSIELRRSGISERLPRKCTRSEIDRKSTRLNSSHDQISYAVFCLKKKKRRRQFGSDLKRAPLSCSNVQITEAVLCRPVGDGTGDGYGLVVIATRSRGV